MSRQTKFKIGDKVRRTSHLANGTHTYGTVDTVVGIKISWEKEWLNTKNNGSADCDADNYELVERAGEQRKDALGAMKMLEIIIIDLTNDLIKNKNPSFSEQTVEMMVDSFKQVRAALQSATISETQLESEIKKTAMSEKKATPVPSNINDNITITMDSKGRMLMKLKPEDEDTPMTDIDKLVQELEGKFYDVPAYDIRQILKYLHSHGYLGASQEKNIKTFFDAWFVFDGDVNGLAEFCDALNWNSFKKGGMDKKGNFIIFLYDGNKTIGAIRSRSTKLHISALNYLMCQD